MRITKQMIQNKMQQVEKALGLPKNSLSLNSYKPGSRRLYKLEFSYDFKERGLNDQNFCQYFSDFMYIKELYPLLQGILAGIERYKQLKDDTKPKPK